MKYFETISKRGSTGAGSGGSLRSSDTPDDLSSPGGCPTPSSSSGGDPSDPAEVAFTVGVTESTPYGCQFCEKAFPRLTYLKRHEQIHSDQMPFRCDYCQRLFKHKRSRDRHVKLHTGDRKYRCSQCESAFSRSDHLKIHMKTHDNGKPYQCVVCNRGYNTAAALSSHMQNHKKAEATANDTSLVEKECRDDNDTPDPPKPLICSFCPQVCTSPTALGEHVLQAHHSMSSPLSESPRSPNRKPCTKCTEELASPNAICPHRKSYSEAESDKSNQDGNKVLPDRFSPGSKLTCGFCSKSDFPTFESLQLHVQVLHLPTGGSDAALAASIRSLMHKRPPNSHPDPFISYHGFDCDTSLSALHFLQKQAALGDGFMLKRPNDTYCSQCNIGFTSSAALLDHVQMVHENVHGQRSQFSPNHGNKRSLSSSRLRPNGAKHLKSSGVLGTTHSTLFNGTASSHYRRQDPGGGQTPLNSGQNPTNNTATLLCSQCNAGFTDFESFRTHLKSHLDAAAAPAAPSTQQRHFTCPECGAEMSSESQLDSHVAGHYLSASTEYGCQSCLKLFSKPDELQKHLMDVHAYHMYRCALCKQMFDSKVSIQVHFAVKHSNECRSLKCTSCSAYFRTELEFQVHVKLAHLATKNFNNNTNYRCLLCDQLFPNEVQLQYHASTHKKQFSCSVCGEAFHVEFLLDRHMQTIHQGTNTTSPPMHSFMGLQKGTPVSQPVSGTSQSSQQSEEAQNLCTKKPSNGPSIVDKQSCDTPPAAPLVSSPVSSTMTTSPLSVRHKEHKTAGNSTSGSSVVSLFCAYCNESCKSRRELENHMKSHASPSKHKCNICDEMCPSATTLAEHKLTHCKVVSGSTCIVCRVQLSTEDQFLSHLQQHNSPTGNSNGLPVPCVVCRQTLVVDVEVRMHARFHLKNVSLEPTLLSSAPCCVCSRMFDQSNLIIRGSVKSSNNTLPSHTYMCKSCFHSKGDDDISRCSDCGVKFESFGDLEVHRRTVHQKKSYQCIKCQMSFETEAEIQAHVTCHVMQEGTHLECRLCHEVLDSPSKLQCHLIEHNYEGSSNFTCYLCASAFTSSQLLQRHMLEHGLDARPYDCTDCNQKFFFRSELDNHSYIHVWENMKRFQTANNSAQNSGGKLETSPMIYECRQCLGSFGSSVELSKHQRTHNHDLNFKHDLIIGRSSMSCSSCNLEFGSKEDLMNHMMLMHPAVTLRDGLGLERGSQQDLYQFDEDSLETSSSNQEFGKAGREKRSFECPLCKKRFPRKEARKLHMKSHHSNSGIKGYSCTHCDKVLQKRSQLKEHMRTHAFSTTQLCEICEEPFPSISFLRRHLRDKHNRRYEHTCVVCDELFDEDKNLREHQEEQHQVKVEESSLFPQIQPKVEKQTSPSPSPEPSSTTTDLRHRSSSNDAESSDTVIDSEVKSEPVEYKEQEERTTFSTEIAA